MVEGLMARAESSSCCWILARNSSAWARNGSPGRMASSAASASRRRPLADHDRARASDTSEADGTGTGSTGRETVVTAAADELLGRAVERLPLSGRGRARVARVARTVAALAGAEGVLPEHVAEALAYRSPTELAA